MKKGLIACFLAGVLITSPAIGFSISYKNEITELEQQVESKSDTQGLVDTISSLRTQLNNLNVKYTTLEANYNAKVSQNDNLSTEKTALETELGQVKQDLSTAQETISDMENTLQNKNLTIEEKQSLIDAYSARIESLELDLLAKENEITRLNGLIADYDEMKNGTCEVNFYVGETLLHTDAITNGQCVESTPTGTEFIVISGWILEDGTAVDPLTYQITENTNFYAVYTQYYTATFMNGSETIGTIKVQENTSFSIDTITQPTTDEEMQEFKGWAKQGTTDIIDFTTHTISEDTVFIAIFDRIAEESNLYELNFVTGKVKNVSSKSITEDYIETNNLSSELYKTLTYKWEHTQPYYIKVWATGILNSSEKEVSPDIASGKFENITEACGSVREVKTVFEFTGDAIYGDASSWFLTFNISSSGDVEIISNLENVTTMLIEVVCDYDDL